MLPPSGDAIMDFVKSWGIQRLLGIIGPDTQFFKCFVTSTNVNYAELIWEEFIQAIQTFLTDKANQGSPTKKGRKDKPHVIPYCRLTKLIICHLGRTHNIHQRSASPFHLAEEDLRLGNLKFVPKGEEDEVFGMPIPNELISNNIRNSPYYDAYLEIVAKHDQKITAEHGGKKKPVTAKQPKPKPAKEKSSKPAPAPKPKVTKEKPSKPSPAKHLKREPEPEPEHQGEYEEYDVERAIHMSLESFQAQSQAHVGGVAIREPVAEATRPLPVVKGKGKAIATDEQAAQSLLALHTPKRRSTTDQFIFQRRTPATDEASTRPSAQPQDDTSVNIVRDSPSPTDAETGADTDRTNSGGDTKILHIGEEQGDDMANVVNLEEKTAEIDEGQAGSDPGKTPESRPPPDDDKMNEDQAGSDPGESRVALAGPNPKPTNDEFMANVYPNIHESLKFLADEHVILEDPLSSTGTLSSMKNLDDAFTIGDQFINDKSTEDEHEKLNVEAEVVSMVTVLICQASSSVPPLSTPVIDLSHPKPVSSSTQAPIFTATTTTTTTLPLPYPLQQQTITDSELVARVTTLEQKFSAFEQKSNTLDHATQNLRSRVFTLELQDLPHKINQTVNEVVKEAVHVALQAPLRDRFKDLPEADIKEMLHQRMFESGSYKSHPEHVALYEALEASMKRAQRDELLAKNAKSRKRRRDYQDPPPPPPVSDPSKKRRHASDASGSSQSPAPQSSAWKTSDTREAPSSSSKQQETDSAHLPKIKPRPEWLKPNLEEDRPETPERPFLRMTCLNQRTTRQMHSPIPTKIQWKTNYFGRLVIWDHSSHGFAKGLGRRSSMEECHRMLTDQVDLVNPEGHRLVPDVSKLLPLGGPPDQIVLRIADYKEYKISEADFKNLYPNDFEDLYLLHLQDYTIVSKLRVVIYKDRNDQKKLMRETKVHKFSDGTLNRILDKLDHMVKDFKLYEYNPGMETRIWSVDDRRRSKDFMEVIERRLKIRRIFRSLESFVGGRLRDVGYRLIQRME
ncbi:hypothetical protein Tco_1507953 [Tanacetum coccineum]